MLSTGDSLISMSAHAQCRQVHVPRSLLCTVNIGKDKEIRNLRRKIRNLRRKIRNLRQKSVIFAKNPLSLPPKSVIFAKNHR